MKVLATGNDESQASSQQDPDVHPSPDQAAERSEDVIKAVALQARQSEGSHSLCRHQGDQLVAVSCFLVRIVDDPYSRGKRPLINGVQVANDYGCQACLNQCTRRPIGRVNQLSRFGPGQHLLGWVVHALKDTQHTSELHALSLSKS